MNGRSHHRLVLLFAIALLGGAKALPAQRILGMGSDAVLLPRGAFRIGLGGEHTIQRDRWNDAALEGLGGSITTDAFGPLQFSLLAPIEQVVRSLGVAGFEASLGQARLDARQRVFAMPLSIEYGLTEWLTLGARASLVRSKAEVNLRIRADSGRSTLGLNPIFSGSGVAAINLAVVGAYSSAGTNLASRRDACQANAGAHPECPTILAELGDVSALAARTTDFAVLLTRLYGAGLVRGQRYVPYTGSAADTVLRARVDSLRLALERYGVTNVTPATGLPVGAQLPLAGEDVDRLVRDSLDGYGARALNDAGLTQIGDVFASARIRLFDSFAANGMSRFATGARGWRQSVLVEYRQGTGHRERPDAFLDLGTGTGTSALTVRSLTDIVFGDRFWASMAVGYSKAANTTLRLRVPSSAGSEWLEVWRERDVPVVAGGELDIELTPRWQFGDYVSLGAQWRWRRKAADRHDLAETTVEPTGGLAALDASLLDAATRQDEQRIGVLASFSTLAAGQRGLRRMPIEVTYAHVQSMASASGIVPKQWEDRLQIRYYARFLGR